MLASLAQIPFTPILFYTFYIYYMLDIIASYHCLQFQGKVMNHTWENAKKPSFVTKLASSALIWAPETFLVDFNSTRY